MTIYFLHLLHEDVNMKLTQLSINKIPIPVNKQKIYYDDNLKGFAVRVTSTGIKSYCLEKKMGNKLRRITISRTNELSLDDAKKEAQKLLGSIAIGANPYLERKMSGEKYVNIYDIFQMYLHARKHLSISTINTYNRVMNNYLKEWHVLTPCFITKEMISKKHIELAEEHDPATANLTMTLLKSIYNFYKAMNDDVNIKNPVDVLSTTRSWYKIPVRKNYIKKNQLKQWHTALNKCSLTMKDYLLFVLFTGLRSQEAATLKWEQVDFKSRTFKILDTKNKVPHELPMSDFLYSLLFYRDKSGVYVFSGTGKKGHIVNNQSALKNIIAECGVKFMVHDLRRTFATIADSLDISSYTLKRLLNHKSTADVTAGYIGSDIERLRKPMEEISQFILNEIG